MHDILDKRHQGAHLHTTLVNTNTAEPYDCYRHKIHGHHHKRHSTGHDSIDSDSSACQVEVCIVKAPLFIVNAVKGAYHSNTGKAFTKNTVDPIQFLLHYLKQRSTLFHHNSHTDYNHRNNYNNDPG